MITLGIFKHTFGISAGDFCIYTTAFVTLVTGFESIIGKGIIWSWIKKQFTYKKRINNSLDELKVCQLAQSKVLDKIMYELNFNGSGSTKDAVYRIEGKVNVIDQRQITMYNRQKSLINIQESPMFITDSKGMLTYVNPAWLKFFGVEDEETVYQMGWVQLIPVNQREEVIAGHWRMIKNPSPVAREVSMLHAKTGELLKVFCRTDVYLNEKKELLEIVGHLDIKK